MFASPIAWADDDKGRRGGEHRGGDEGARRVTVLVQSPAQSVVVVQRRDDDDENEDEDRDERAVVLSVTPLVNAINNEVANLMNREVRVEDEDEDEDEVEDEEVEEVEDVDIDRVAVISLTALADSTTDAPAVRAAAANNRAALLNFLNNGTALANAIKAALTAAGIHDNLDNLQAVLLGRGHRLIVVTSP